MKKISRLPHEQLIGEQNDGLGAEHDARPDVEGHVRLGGGEGFGPGQPGTGGDQLSPGMPGTGGDQVRRPVGGGEVDDVEGHAMGHTKGEKLSPGMPGTGGDLRATDDGSDSDPHGIRV
jgi:hypothetical protein